MATAKKTGFWSQVAAIQNTLSAPKGKENKFGGYKFRSAEDILEAVKPLLGDLVLTISDDIEMIGDRFYVKATATITDGEHSVSNCAYAREALTKKGMDEAQITGSSSSYARKYCLNGLFCIDDATRDPDSNEHQEIRNDADQDAIGDLIKRINDSTSTDELLVIRNEIKPAVGEQPSTETQLWYAGLTDKLQKRIQKAFEAKWTECKEAA